MPKKITKSIDKVTQASKSKKITKDSKVTKKAANKVMYPHITSHVLMVEPT